MIGPKASDVDAERLSRSRQTSSVHCGYPRAGTCAGNHGNTSGQWLHSQTRLAVHDHTITKGTSDSKADLQYWSQVRVALDVSACRMQAWPMCRARVCPERDHSALHEGRRVRRTRGLSDSRTERDRWGRAVAAVAAKEPCKLAYIGHWTAESPGRMNKSVAVLSASPVAHPRACGSRLLFDRRTSWLSLRPHSGCCGLPAWSCVMCVISLSIRLHPAQTDPR